MSPLNAREASSIISSPLREYGETALDNGYIIVPVAPFEKKPSMMNARGAIKPMSDWEKMTRAKAEKDVDLWKSWGPGWGFGILAGMSSTEHGGILPVDIDITDRDASDRIRDMARDMLGPTGFIRVGNQPKQMMFYRMSQCFKKMKVGNVELLGIGNQFIAAGYHPITRGLYQHTGSDGALFDSHVEYVPHVEHTQFLEFLRAIAIEQHGAGSSEVTKALRGVLKALSHSSVTPESFAFVEDMYGIELKSKSASYASAVPTEPSRIAELLEAIPNDGSKHWDFYGQEIFGAVFHETGGSDDGFRLATHWSAKSLKHDPSADAKRWEELRCSPMTGYKIGTLYHHAFGAGWVRPAEERVVLEVEHSVRDVTGMVAVELPEEVSIEEAQRRTMAKAQHARDFIKSPPVVQQRLVRAAWLSIREANNERARAEGYLRRLSAGYVVAYNNLPDTREEAITSALRLGDGRTDFSKLRSLSEAISAIPGHGGFDLKTGMLSFEHAVAAYEVVHRAAPPNKQDRIAAAVTRLEQADAAVVAAHSNLSAALLRARIEGVDIADPRKNPLPLLWPKGHVTVMFREPPSSGKSHAVNSTVLTDKDIRSLVITSDHGGGGTKRLSAELQHLGDDFAILRGMTAENPDAAPLPDGTQPKMCAFAHMIPLVKAAGGMASSMCGKPGTGRVCPNYNSCPFVQQPRTKRVTVVAGADAAQFFPDVAKKADALIYDDVAASRMQVVEDAKVAVFCSFGAASQPEASLRLGNYAMDACVRFVADLNTLIDKAHEGNGRLSPTLIEEVMPDWVARGVIDQIADDDWPSEDELPEMWAQGWSPFVYVDCFELIEVEANLRRMVVPLHTLITPGEAPLAFVDPAVSRWNAACLALADAADTLISTMTSVRRVARAVRVEGEIVLRTTRNVELPDGLAATPVLFLDGTAEEQLVMPALGNRRMGLPLTTEEKLGNELGHAVDVIKWREPFRIKPFDGVEVMKLAGSEMTLGKLVPPNRDYFGDDDTTMNGMPTNAAFEKAKVTTANNRDMLHRLSLRMRLFHGIGGTGFTAPKGVEPLLQKLEGGLLARLGSGAGVLAQPVLWRQEYKARGDNGLSGVTGYISASRLGSQPVHYEDAACVAFGMWLELEGRHKPVPAYYPLRDGRVLEGRVSVNINPMGEIFRRDQVLGSVGQNGALRPRMGSSGGRACLAVLEAQAEPSGLYAYDRVVTVSELRQWANDVMVAGALGLLPLTHAAEVLAGPAGVSVTTMGNRLRLVDLQERRDLDELVEMYRQGTLPWQTASVWLVPVAGLAEPATVVLSVPKGDVLAATRLLDAHRVALSGVPTPAALSEAPKTAESTTVAPLSPQWRSDPPNRVHQYGVSDLYWGDKGGRVAEPAGYEHSLPEGPWGDSAALLTGTIFELPARAGVFARPGIRGFNKLMAHLNGVTSKAVECALENEHLRSVLEAIMPEEVNMTNAVVAIKLEGMTRAVNAEVMLVHPASELYLKAKGLHVVMTGSFACEL